MDQKHACCRCMQFVTEAVLRAKFGLAQRRKAMKCHLSLCSSSVYAMMGVDIKSSAFAAQVDGANFMWFGWIGKDPHEGSIL